MANTLSKTLEKIRVQFLFDHPFLSVLALSLPFVSRENPHEVFETNGIEIYFDEAKAKQLSAEGIKFMYAHIIMHILLKHAFRMKDRDHKVWNRSSDIVINLLLDDFERVGERPEEEVLLKKFKNRSVEEVYNTLYQEDPEGEGTPDEENPQEQKQDLIENEGDSDSYDVDLDALIVQALGSAQKQGNIPASFLEVISEVTRPKIDLETLLQTYLTESYFDKVSDFARPNRRFIHQNIYLPGYKREQNRINLYIALDRSMSISRETFSKFLGIIEGVLQMGIEYEIIVIPFDESVDENAVVYYNSEHHDSLDLLFEKGNGGTIFSCVIDYLEQKGSSSDSTLMVLSDGLFKIEKPSEMSTLFLISEKANMKRLEPYGNVFYFDL